MTTKKTTTKTVTTTKEEPKVLFEDFYTQDGLILGKIENVHGLKIKKCRTFKGESKEEVIDKFKEAFHNNTLDPDYDVDKTIAAGVQLIHKTTILYKGKEYINTTKQNVVIGDTELFLNHPCIVDNIDTNIKLGVDIEKDLILYQY